MSDLPTELLVRPLALIALTGLDISNTMHRSVWDAFSNNRRLDSAPFHFKLLSPKHEFPKPKTKRNSYEWYTPKGILKRNWMNKYLNEIPSIVVYFHDLDWTDLRWNEKKMECASKVQSLKSALQGRSTKIVVVLIQRETAFSPGSEDATSTERASSLCSSCELPANSLFILPHGDHLLGYISRLENAFYDLAQNFYNHKCKIVKIHRDHLNKNSHQYLFVRHQFKVAFLNELKQEIHIALKHYQQCYNLLLEIRIVDSNIFEIKTIASFVNYKLCKLMFNLNQPRDAISQFRAHTDRYRSRTGPVEIMFEHHAWMAHQCSTFAELFDEAIRQGLPAVQTQHPGYYFQLAAQYAELRKISAEKRCRQVVATSSYDLDRELSVLNDDTSEFFGQRSWRSDQFGLEPVDSSKEKLAFRALQVREKEVNHSMIVIALLGNAISQFKIYRCPRLRGLLVVKMASEYHNIKDYGKVLTLLMHMLTDYRGELWSVLLTDILSNGLQAAFLSTSIQEYLTIAFEALGPFTTLSDIQKFVIQENIRNIVHKKAPNPEPNWPEDQQKEAIEKWTAALSSSENVLFTIEGTAMTSFIQMKAKFSSEKYVARSSATIEILVRNVFEGNIEFSNMMVGIWSLGYNSEFPLIESNLKFKPKETKKYVCIFRTPDHPGGSEIQISAISLNIGNEKDCKILMKFSSLSGYGICIERFYSEFQQLREESFEKMRSITVAEVIEEQAIVTIEIEANSPALLSEWMSMKILVSSTEDVSNVVLQIHQVLEENNADSDTEFSFSLDHKQTDGYEHNSISLRFGNIEGTTEKGKIRKLEKLIFIRSHEVGIKNFSLRLEYLRNDQTNRTKESTYSLSVVKPFDVSTLFYSQKFDPLTKTSVNENSIVMPHIVCTSPWPLRFLKTSIVIESSISGQVETDGNNTDHSTKGTILCDGESATDVFWFVPKPGSKQPISSGLYTIRWRREGDGHCRIETSTIINLRFSSVEDVSVGLEADIPAYGFVRAPLFVSYNVFNHSDSLITFRLNIEASDAFMFAGQKEIDVCSRPRSRKKVEWILRPLVAGFVALPTLSLTNSTVSDDDPMTDKSRLFQVLRRSLPTHIYIMPEHEKHD